MIEKINVIPTNTEDGVKPIVINDVFDLIIGEYCLLNHVKGRPTVEALVDFTFAASVSPLMQKLPESRASRYTSIFPDGNKETPDYRALENYVAHISTQTKWNVKRNLQGFAKKISKLAPATN
jgi:hypothetical protein